MTKEEFQQFVKTNRGVINAICDIMAQQRVSPDTGANILLYIAGMSLGVNGFPIPPRLEILAISWQLGAAEGL